MCYDYVAEICHGTNTNYINTVKKVCTAAKSCRMKALQGSFKRRFGTAPSILAVQVEKNAPKNNSVTLWLIENKDFSNNFEETGIANAVSIKIRDYLLFRGTDELPFKILEITEEYLFDEISPATEIKANFLQCIRSRQWICYIYCRSWWG